MVDVSELPTKLRRLATGILALIAHIRRHPRIYITIGILLLMLSSSYMTLYMYYIQPARRTVQEYFRNIDNHNLAVSWNLLDGQYQTRWRDGIQQFLKGYSSTVSTENLDISDSWQLRKLPNVFKSSSIELEVRFTVLDRFQYSDLLDPIQSQNIHWLSIKYPQRLTKLQERDPNVSSLELKRDFCQTFVVAKKNEGWRISSTSTKSITLQY
jgi:hypothetical protein